MNKTHKSAAQDLRERVYNTGTGQMIYMDPLKGTTDRNEPSFFFQQFNMSLIKNKE